MALPDSPRMPGRLELEYASERRYRAMRRHGWSKAQVGHPWIPDRPTSGKVCQPSPVSIATYYLVGTALHDVIVSELSSGSRLAFVVSPVGVMMTIHHWRP